MFAYADKYQYVMEVVCNWLSLLTGSHEQLQLVFSSLYVNHVKPSVCDDFTAYRYEEGIFWHQNPDRECNSAPFLK